MGKKIIAEPMSNPCKGHLLAVHDTLDLLSGKWKIAIISSLSFNKKRRFGELQRDVSGIGAKMLSKELRDLEINGLVKRTVFDTKPVTVEYELTEYGSTLEEIILAMSKWGHQHRQRIIAEMAKEEVVLETVQL
jgi:DNA-binding HxlR family transcriptional regulator